MKLLRRLLVLALAVVLMVGVVQFNSVQAAAAVDEPVQQGAPAAPETALEAGGEASAALTARLRGKRVEVTSARTETATVWANPDGTFTRDEAASPIRVKVGQQWQPIYVSLVEKDGTYQAKAACNGVKFAKTSGTTLATFTRGKAQLEVGWKAKLPTPEVSGGVARYAIDATTDFF